MRTIWKYKIDESMRIQVPKGAKILSCAGQGTNITVWVVLDPKEEEMTEINFEVYATGEEFPPIPETWYFLATVFTHGGVLVYHVFIRP